MHLRMLLIKNIFEPLKIYIYLLNEINPYVVHIMMYIERGIVDLEDTESNEINPYGVLRP